MQRWLNALPYNTETGGETQRSFRPVARLETAHCMEAALFAAVVLEQHGYPPLVMSLESQDWLDHVIFVYRHATGWGSVGALARSGTARPQAALPLAARAGAQLLRRLRRLHRPPEGFWRWRT